MIERYSLPEMKEIWSEENKFKKWLEVELAVCEAWSYLGKIPPDALERIKNKANFSFERIKELEKTTKHDMVAFTTCVGEYIGDDSRYFHMGLTSYDVVDTALSILIRDSLKLIIEKSEKLKDILKEKALEWKEIPVMGRTHGVHAEPITFGFKFLIYYEEMKRNLERLRRAKQNIKVGRISGSVGTYVHLEMEVEKIACEKLKLTPESVSNQVIQRDRHAEVLSALAILSGTLEKIATEIRHLQRTEVLEAEEFFSEGQKGSSSMPHKRNPVRTERICGLSRVIRSYLISALENINLWHERDISHSSVERIIFPESFLITDFMLTEMIDIISTLIIYPERMKKNFERSLGLIFSQRLLHILTEKGLSREKAYELVQRNSLKAWNQRKQFKDVLREDKEIMEILKDKNLDEIFDIRYFLRNIDKIYKRVMEES
ncbi:MAG: adenylosuccinate lyase [Candidatus Aminicenantia bacterium]